MSNTVIIIPSRLQAKRLPDKPLKLIKNKELILHVYDLAVKSKVGEVLVVTPDQIIAELIKNNGGKSFITKKEHHSGTDRIFEGFQDFFSSKSKVIINLQGDMPNLDPNSIVELNDYLNRGLCDIGTLASSIKNKDELLNKNIVKVVTKNRIEKSIYSEAIDFERDISSSKSQFIYHHVGIYAFTKEALMRYVKLKRTKLELERKLEQMRAMENKMKIHVGYVFSNPLSVDTNQDLSQVKKVMEDDTKS